MKFLGITPLPPKFIDNSVFLLSFGQYDCGIKTCLLFSDVIFKLSDHVILDMSSTIIFQLVKLNELLFVINKTAVNPVFHISFVEDTTITDIFILINKLKLQNKNV